MLQNKSVEISEEVVYYNSENNKGNIEHKSCSVRIKFKVIDKNMNISKNDIQKNTAWLSSNKIISED